MARSSLIFLRVSSSLFIVKRRLMIPRRVCCRRDVVNEASWGYLSALYSPRASVPGGSAPPHAVSAAGTSGGKTPSDAIVVIANEALELDSECRFALAALAEEQEAVALRRARLGGDARRGTGEGGGRCTPLEKVGCFFCPARQVMKWFEVLKAGGTAAALTCGGFSHGLLHVRSPLRHLPPSQAFFCPTFNPQRRSGRRGGRGGSWGGHAALFAATGGGCDPRRVLGIPSGKRGRIGGVIREWVAMRTAAAKEERAACPPQQAETWSRQ